MALPRLNESPKYNITIPSTGVKTKFRPFLVKEEKILLLAMESEDKNQIITSIANTIEACVDNIQINSLTSYDLEYIFTKLRSKSVGETVKAFFKCSECEAENDIEINFDKVKITNNENINEKISLDKNILLEMKHPTYNELLNVDETASQTEQLFNLIKMCMKTLYTEDERINLKEEAESEINTFIESMNSSQLKQITDYIDKIPTLEYDVKFNCKECNHENKIKLTRFEDFFV